MLWKSLCGTPSYLEKHLASAGSTPKCTPLPQRHELQGILELIFCSYIFKVVSSDSKDSFVQTVPLHPGHTRTTFLPSDRGCGFESWLGPCCICYRRGESCQGLSVFNLIIPVTHDKSNSSQHQCKWNQFTFILPDRELCFFLETGFSEHSRVLNIQVHCVSGT